jgi:hypothetical protein
VVGRGAPAPALGRPVPALSPSPTWADEGRGAPVAALESRIGHERREEEDLDV